MTVNKKCFIITPIGGDGSEIRRKADGVINSVIKPILKEMGFTDIKAAHEITSPGSINKQVINRIIEDDLVIANLTGLNPNVMYELAVRHATMKPIVHICENNTKLPFDIVDQRSIFYNDDMYGTEELKSKLVKMVNSCLDVENKDNPIYSATQDKIFREVAASSNETNLEGYVIDRIDNLEALIQNLSNNITNKYQVSSYTEEFVLDIESSEEINLDNLINNIYKNCKKENIKLENFSISEPSKNKSNVNSVINMYMQLQSYHIKPTKTQVTKIISSSLDKNMKLLRLDMLPF
ncbi:hypothetical protein GOQ27_15160 [Clostridium sp. D2Q-11]|uniref:Nucleoside 2-deoxyribosyltransferase n=1 Tax=Anaeromonas frigoriresistens TaxID=2683708 RepID=A0A942Z8I1_9FIRM|nr:hypothetical protein [Anaeromonas frigoriresistens]MBS4539812.1 hypothetical protein [Anaeromonas frigoriresistens]